MSVKHQISPYLNRFVALVKNRANAKLELHCKDGRITVNISHELGEVEETVPETIVKPSYTDILKRNVNVTQQKRLQRRAVARAEEALKSTKEQQKIAENAEQSLKRAKLEAEKAIGEAIEAKLVAEQAKLEAEKAKLEAEQAKLEGEETKALASQAKKEAKNVVFSLPGTEVVNVNDTGQLNETLPLPCDSCGIEFINEENLRDHIENCNVCEVTLPSNECLTEHNWNEHPELLCEECNQYMLNIDKLEDHKNGCFECVVCRNIFKGEEEIEDHKNKCFECSACGDIFTSENDLNTHKRENPNNKCDKYSYEDSEDEDLEFVEECDICEEMFRRKTELLHHKNEEHVKVEMKNIEERSIVNHK